jgi:hypothetical protein
MALNAFIGGGGKDRGSVKRCDQNGKESQQECSSVFHNTSSREEWSKM